MRHLSFPITMVSLSLFPWLLFAQEEDTPQPSHTKQVSFTWDQLQQREAPRIKIYVISTATDLDAISDNDSFRIIRGRRNREFLVRVDHSPAVREAFRGSPYLYATTYPATLTDRSGETYERVPLRYDLYKDCLEYLKEGKPVTLDPADVPAFTFIDSLSGQARHFRNGFDPPEGLPLRKASYFELLYDGTTKLLRHLQKRPFNQVDGSPHNAILNKGVYTFSGIEEAYFLLKDGNMLPVKARRSQILEALDDRKEELLEFSKTNHIDAGNTEGIRQILIHYDYLQQAEHGREGGEK